MIMFVPYRDIQRLIYIFYWFIWQHKQSRKHLKKWRAKEEKKMEGKMPYGVRCKRCFLNATIEVWLNFQCINLSPSYRVGLYRVISHTDFNTDPVTTVCTVLILRQDMCHLDMLLDLSFLLLTMHFQTNLYRMKDIITPQECQTRYLREKRDIQTKISIIFLVCG